MYNTTFCIPVLWNIPLATCTFLLYTVLPKNLVCKPRGYKKLERYPMVYPSTTFHTFFTTYTLDTRTTCFTVSSSFLVDDRKYKKVCYCSHVMHLTLNTLQTVKGLQEVCGWCSSSYKVSKQQKQCPLTTKQQDDFANRETAL